jgi:enamine deaminase RidA (YjgF/YER057c/UK114 family)
MKPLLFALAAVGVAASSNAAEITRITNPPPAIILGGVVIPPGAELFLLSGQLASPIDPSKPATSIEAFGDTKTQTISTFTKIKAALEKQGYSLADVVKLTVFVAGDPKLGGKMDFAGFNDGYKQFFGTAENPNLVARSTVQVAALAGPNYLIEIEATAAKLPKKK